MSAHEGSGPKHHVPLSGQEAKIKTGLENLPNGFMATLCTVCDGSGTDKGGVVGTSTCSCAGFGLLDSAGKPVSESLFWQVYNSA